MSKQIRPTNFHFFFHLRVSVGSTLTVDLQRWSAPALHQAFKEVLALVLFSDFSAHA